MVTLWYVKFTCRVTEVTKKASNGLDQGRLEHPDRPSPPTHPAITPLSPPFLRSSIPIDGHFEGLLAKMQVHHGSWKESTEGGQCTYIFFHWQHRLLTVATLR